MKTRFLSVFSVLACAFSGVIQAQSTYEPYHFGIFADIAGRSGRNDGTGSATRFSVPSQVALDPAGNVFVENHTIRKVTPGGAVPTLAGLARSVGADDGTGSGARFHHLFGVAVGNTDRLYLADSNNHTMRVGLLTLPPTLGNYPDKAIPLSTDTTVTPFVAPTNTTSISAFTSTNFKGRLEGDPATGVVRVTNAHPAGAFVVTVTAFDGGSQRATKTFALTVVTPATCNPVSFAAAANFGAGSGPFSVAVGDFDGDGRQDLAVANAAGSNDVSILLSDGAGHFGAATNFTVGSGPHSVAVGDFNEDGKQDLAVANESSNDVSILLGDGAGHFSAASNFGAGSNPGSVAVGDYNADGKQDLAVTNINSANVSILLADGAGTFASATNFDAGTMPTSVAVGDYNGDGKQDLAVANVGSQNVSILLGDGAGGFNATANFAAGDNPYAVVVGDFNGDSKQDLAVANEGSDLSILLGDGAGHFSAAINFGVGSFSVAVAVGDFNGDEKQDLAVANISSNNVSILLRDCGPTPTGFVIGDRNAVIGNHVTFWGAQWAKQNLLTGGSAPSSFKGFANSPNPYPPICGGTWRSEPGNSSGPPASVPSFINVIVASSITKSGSIISGNIPKMVTLRTDPGYGPNPGHAGTGTVVAVICP